jgi:hypothetical protein
MRILVVVLTLISVTFAGTTMYFARELELERERTRTMPAPRARPPSSIATPLSRLEPASPPAARPAVAPESADAESDDARLQRMQVEQSLRVVEMLEDPERRRGMLIETRMSLRNGYPRLAQTIGLSSEEADRLFTLLALQQIDAQEKYARCTIDATCDVRNGAYFQQDLRAREIADLLGADRQQQFESYKNTLMERESVTHLRTRLSDASRLPDGAAEALVAALADERQRIHQEAAARGVGMNGYGTGIGVVFSASDAPTPEAQLESAQANSQRMRARAAEVLTAEQLRAFDEMQEELLISLRHQVRQKEDLAADTSVATATVVD